MTKEKNTLVSEITKPEENHKATKEEIKANIMQMYQYIYGNWITMITYVYAELDIAHLLHESPKLIEEIAALTQTEVSALERLLRCAGALGFHRTDPDTGKLMLTDFGFLLCSESPFCLRAAARLNGAPYRYQPWGHLLEYVKSGTGKGLSPTWEKGSLEYLKDKPELLEVFEEAMTNLSQSTYHNINENKVIAESFDFSRFNQVLDIGCGNGALLEAILLANRKLQGALFDLENVLENIKLPVADHPNANRVDKVPGDFYQSIPSGYDAYIMKNVIHNHPEHRCKKILNNIRRAILEGDNPKDKRLLMFEIVIPDASEKNMISKLIDMNLNLLVDGSDRTYGDYDTLLNEAGFELLSVADLPGLERKVLTAVVKNC
jgi:SAM-dependent methyltransferase